MKLDKEMAIIGYWRVEDEFSDDFVCYHYFYVNSPLKRDAKRSDRKEHNDKKKTNISSK